MNSPDKYQSLPRHRLVYSRRGGNQPAAPPPPTTPAPAPSPSQLPQLRHDAAVPTSQVQTVQELLPSRNPPENQESMNLDPAAPPIPQLFSPEHPPENQEMMNLDPPAPPMPQLLCPETLSDDEEWMTLDTAPTHYNISVPSSSSQLHPPIPELNPPVNQELMNLEIAALTPSPPQPHLPNPELQLSKPTNPPENQDWKRSQNLTMPILKKSFLPGKYVLMPRNKASSPQLISSTRNTGPSLSTALLYGPPAATTGNIPIFQESCPTYKNHPFLSSSSGQRNMPPPIIPNPDVPESLKQVSTTKFYYAPKNFSTQGDERKLKGVNVCTEEAMLVSTLKAGAHHLSYYVNSEMDVINLDVKCLGCKAVYAIKIDFKEGIASLGQLLKANRASFDIKQVPAVYLSASPKICDKCQRMSVLQPVHGPRKRDINWLGLLLAQELGSLTTEQLVYFGRKNGVQWHNLTKVQMIFRCIDTLLLQLGIQTETLS